MRIQYVKILTRQVLCVCTVSTTYLNPKENTHRQFYTLTFYLLHIIAIKKSPLSAGGDFYLKKERGQNRTRSLSIIRF